MRPVVLIPIVPTGHLTFIQASGDYHRSQERVEREAVAECGRRTVRYAGTRDLGSEKRFLTAGTKISPNR